MGEGKRYTILFILDKKVYEQIYVFSFEMIFIAFC